MVRSSRPASFTGAPAPTRASGAPTETVLPVIRVYGYLRSLAWGRVWFRARVALVCGPVLFTLESIYREGNLFQIPACIVWISAMNARSEACRFACKIYHGILYLYANSVFVESMGSGRVKSKRRRSIVWIEGLWVWWIMDALIFYAFRVYKFILEMENKYICEMELLIAEWDVCLRLRFNGLGILVGVNEYVNCRKCVTFLSMSVNLIIIEEVFWTDSSL